MDDNKIVSIVIHDEELNAEITRHDTAREFWRKQLDKSLLPESMMVMSLASDAQELLAYGRINDAIKVLNDLKIVCDLSLGARDEHGRHLITGVRYE